MRLHQANYQRRLDVLRPNYQRRLDVLRPVNQYGYIRRTIKEDLMFYAQTIKEDLMFHAQSTSTVTSGTNLEGSDIKFANTVRNLGVCLDPTLSFQQQISSVCCMCCLELRRISAILHYLSEDVTKKTVVCICSFKTRLLQLTFGGLS